MSKKVFLFSLFLFFVVQTSNFSVPDKKSTQSPCFVLPRAASDLRRTSKNKLKEDVGVSIKKTLHNCAELTRLMGKIQVELADIQKNLFEKVEELLDNKRPFKSASKVDLADASKVMQNIKLQVLSQIKSLDNLKEQINSNKCLKKVT